jgi:hypothetical protein
MTNFDGYFQELPRGFNPQHQARGSNLSSTTLCMVCRRLPLTNVRVTAGVLSNCRMILKSHLTRLHKFITKDKRSVEPKILLEFAVLPTNHLLYISTFILKFAGRKLPD